MGFEIVIRFIYMFAGPKTFITFEYLAPHVRKESSHFCIRLSNILFILINLRNKKIKSRGISEKIMTLRYKKYVFFD